MVKCINALKRALFISMQHHGDEPKLKKCINALKRALFISMVKKMMKLTGISVSMPLNGLSSFLCFPSEPRYLCGFQMDKFPKII